MASTSNATGNIGEQPVWITMHLTAGNTIGKLTDIYRSSGNGWCFYNSILHAFKQPDTPQNAQCLAQAMVEEIKKLPNYESVVRAAVMSTKVEDHHGKYIAHPTQKGNQIYKKLIINGKTVLDEFNKELEERDISGNRIPTGEHEPYYYKGIYTQKTVTQTEPGKYYIRSGEQIREAIREDNINGYLTSLHTPLNNDITIGPVTWPDIGLMKDVIFSMFKTPFLIYRPGFQYDSEFSRPGTENQQHIVFYGSGAHFDLMRFHKPLPQITNYDTQHDELNKLLEVCANQSTTTATTIPATTTATPSDEIIPYNDIFQTSLDTYIKDPTPTNKNDLDVKIKTAKEIRNRNINSSVSDLLYVGLPDNDPTKNKPENIIAEINRLIDYGICIDTQLKRFNILRFIVEVRGLAGAKDMSNLQDSCKPGYIVKLESASATPVSELATQVKTVSEELKKAQDAHSALMGPADKTLIEANTAAGAYLKEAQDAATALGITLPTSTSAKTSLLSSLRSGASSAYSGAASAYNRAASGVTAGIHAVSGGVQALLTNAIGSLSRNNNVLKTLEEKAKSVSEDSAEGIEIKKQIAELRKEIADLEKNIADLNAAAFKDKIATLEMQGKTSSDEIAKLKVQLKKLTERPATVVTKVEVPSVPVAFSSAVDAKLRNYRPLVKVVATATVTDVSATVIDVSGKKVVAPPVDPTKVPTWAASMFAYTDTKACNSSMFMPDGCESQTLLRHLIGADQIKRSDRFEKSAPMMALRDLQKRLTIETDPEKRNALERQIKENYTDQTRTIDIVTKDGKRLPFTVANPYLAQDQRSKVVSFGDPASNKKEHPIISENLAIINTGIFPKEVLADNAMTISLLRSMWSCGQGGSSTSPDCYPLQVLGELYEYQEVKKQKSYSGRAKELLKFPEWPVIQTMAAALRYALPTATITPDISDGRIDVSGATNPPAAVQNTNGSAGQTTGIAPVITPSAATVVPPPTKFNQPFLPTSFGGGMRMTNFLIPNTFGFAPLRPGPPKT
jgi:hypothetical protein